MPACSLRIWSRARAVASPARRAAQNILPVGLFFGGGAFDIQTHPVVHLAVGHRILDHGHKLLMRQPRSLQPTAVKTLAQIFVIIGMQLASQMQADLVDIAGQIMPARHGFARAPGIDNVTHATILASRPARGNGKIECAIFKFLCSKTLMTAAG